MSPMTSTSSPLSILAILLVSLQLGLPGFSCAHAQVIDRDSDSSALGNVIYRLVAASRTNFEHISIGPCLIREGVRYCNSAIQIPEANKTEIRTRNNMPSEITAEIYLGTDESEAQNAFMHVANQLAMRWPRDYRAGTFKGAPNATVYLPNKIELRLNVFWLESRERYGTFMTIGPR